MGKKVDIAFDENTGKFVVHFEGYATHNDEHAELDRVLAQLATQGFDVKHVEHHHDKPKLPELDRGTNEPPLRERNR